MLIFCNILKYGLWERQGMEAFLGYVIENPSRVFVSVASLGIAVFASLLRGIHAVFASLLAIFGSFVAMML